MRIQLHLLQAVIYRRTGREEWLSEMNSAVALAKKYGLARIIADEGIAIIDLLHEMEFADGRWEEGILHLTRSQAINYPDYLKEIVRRPVFSERE